MPARPVVMTSTGAVEGALDAALGQHRCLGIPYAEPQLGPLRFRQVGSPRRCIGFDPTCRELDDPAGERRIWWTREVYPRLVREERV